MVRGHMEVSERGITISKGLAWTIVGGLLAFGLAAGREMQSLNSSIDSLADTQASRHSETMIWRRDANQRLSVLESSRAADGSELTALRRDVTAARQDMRDLREAIDSLRSALRRDSLQ